MLKQQQLINEQIQTSQQANHLLLDKAIALVGTSDPLAFQAVQAMVPDAEYASRAPYDPSDEGEIERLNAMGRSAQDEVYNGEDYEAAAELGVEPGFFSQFPDEAA